MKYSVNSFDVTSIHLEENNCRSEFIRTKFFIQAEVCEFVAPAE